MILRPMMRRFPRSPTQILIASGVVLVVGGVWLGSRLTSAPPRLRPPPPLESAPVVDPVPASDAMAISAVAAPQTPEPVSADTPSGAPPEGMNGTPEVGLQNLLLPVEGVRGEDLRDNFDEGRGSRHHGAIDILAPRDTPILAVADGPIAKLWQSVPGGLTLYQFDSSGRFCFYYAHLERYAKGLKEGDRIARGAVIGYVGTSGNAPRDTPHLHFAIYRLGPERRWWEGEALNPFPLLRSGN
jgi:murein DD-endopeptidase MepM/ murein hydrolase activator NlpD